MFKSRRARLATAARLFARYHLAPLRTQRLVRSVIARWTRIYDLQQKEQAYPTPRSMFEALDLYGLTQQSSYDFFRQHRILPRFVREFSDGVSRVNYGQDGTMNSFVNTVSLAGAGFAGGQLFSVKDGKVLLCERLLAHAHAEIRTNARVMELAAAQNTPQRNAHYRVVTDGMREDVFDGVILATPVELTPLQCADLVRWSPDQFQRPYQVTHANRHSYRRPWR